MTVPALDFAYDRLPGADGVSLQVAHAGSGTPVVLLHGFPQTHLMWRDVAAELARDHTVVVPDLRGYGESDKPDEAGPETYAKRTMAQDIVTLMRGLDHDRFAVVGHDRGALVAVRAGLDHAETVTHLGILDVLPTLDTWEVLHGVDAKIAWHLYLMAQPRGLPEKMISSVAEEFFSSFLDAWDPAGTTFTPDLRRHYVASSAAAVPSIVADYRASAGIDLEMDRADRDAGRRARHARRGPLPGLGQPARVRPGRDLGRLGCRPDLRAHHRRPLHGRGGAGDRDGLRPPTAPALTAPGRADCHPVQVTSRVGSWRIPRGDRAVEDLRSRLRRTRWPDEVNDQDWGWGVDRRYLKDVVDAWLRFDWGARVEQLNELPQLMAEIGEHRIHVVHLPGPATVGQVRLPLLLLHGWPGSFVEMLSLAPHLQTAGAAYGIGYDLVIPSLPGFGFSSRPSTPGTSPEVTARLLHGLMLGLGHQAYGIQGGDLGAGIAVRMALREPEAVLGIHLNYPAFGVEGVTDDSPGDQGPALARRREEWWQEEGGYQHLHATRPQTLGYALADSPVGLAAWVTEKFHAWTDRTASGGAVPIGMDELLTNLSVYWFSETITSSMRMYKESAADPLVLSPRRRIEVPLGVSAFPHELPIQPRALVAQVARLVRWTDMPRGGHFAALEAPDLLGDDVSAFFSQLLLGRP